MTDLSRPSRAPWSPANLEGAWSRVLGVGPRSYRLWVSAPDAAAPAEGFAAIWVLDGEALFPLAAETARRLGRRPGVTGLSPCVVIGVDRDPSGKDARYGDYAPWPAGAEGPQDVETGGADRFLDMLTGIFRDAVSEIAPLDPARQALLGHSMAGQFALYAMTARPGAFRVFGAMSPSLWWDGPRLDQALQSMPDQGQAAFLAVGEREQPDPVITDDDRRRAARRMVSRTRATADLVAGRLGQDRAEFHLGRDEDHASVVPACLPAFLRFAGRRL